jgi:two-component system, cell cycle response regulator
LATQEGERRILLVDDLALTRRMVPARLGSLGRLVASVPSVTEAKLWLAQRLPDLILLDIVMPGMDGLTFCRELKMDARTRHIPVIILTDLARQAHERSLEAGADDYMPKRVNDALMRIRVKLHLQLTDLRRAASLATPIRKASILVATPAPGIATQLSAQFSVLGHQAHVASTADEILSALRSEDRLLILDEEFGTEAVGAILRAIRMEHDMAGIPIVFLVKKDDMDQLTAIEFMVDDVLWKPLNAPITRHRLSILLELASRLYSDQGAR